jgi:hypothetical protein
MALAIVLSLTSSASAERLWEGHIHFVDCRLKLSFADYGSTDMTALRYVEIKTGRAGKFHQAGFSFVADDDDPLQATFTGNIRVVVDGWSAETPKLRLVRKTQYSQTWEVHPDDVKRLVELSKQQNEK